jgi:predicted nucleotidyltransferase
MLDKKEVRKIAIEYSKEVNKVLNPISIILFGSYVNGSPNEWSDIDIAVLVDGFKGDWYDTQVLLCRLKRNVSLDIEPHLLDAAQDPSGFVKHVVETGEVIYQAA